MDSRAKVFIPPDIKPPPMPHEVEAAWILARHFNCEISKNTIEYIFRKALEQSRYIVIDGRRTKLTDTIMESKIRYEVRKRSQRIKVIYVKKSLDVVEIVK